MRSPQEAPMSENGEAPLIRADRVRMPRRTQEAR